MVPPPVLALLLLGSGALGTPPPPPGPAFAPIAPHGLTVPSIVGTWQGRTQPLPDDKVPVNPLLGNGYTGVILQGDPSAMEININTNDMWCVNAAQPCSCKGAGCHCPPAPPPTPLQAQAGNIHPPVPTAHRVALGGVWIVTQGASFSNFSAEQQLGPGRLLTRQVGADGTLTVTIAMHPQQQVLVANVSWSGATPIAVNITTWAASGVYHTAPPSALGALDGPPTQVGGSSASCCDATGGAVVCTDASAMHCVSRNASGFANTPRQVWAGLATKLVGGKRGATVAAHNVSKNATGNGGGESFAPRPDLMVSATSTLITVGAGETISAITAVRTSAFPSNLTAASDRSPLLNAAALASSTDAAELSAEAEADWASFWTKSVSELPIDLLPALENNCRIDLIDFIGV